MVPQGSLTSDQLQFFNSEGYLLIEGFANPKQCKGLMQRMEELLQDFDPSDSSIFSTRNQPELTANHFYESAEKISFFFEERAFDDNGKLKQPKQLSINKVGHALHELEPEFVKFSCSDKVSKILASLNYKKPAIIQSMYIFKQPGIGGEVVPHQDNCFLYTDPPSCTALWLALEDATIENGCLWALPKSQKGGLARRFIRDGDGVHFDNPSPSYSYEDFVPLEVKAGTLVLIHGDLVHQSFVNQSSKSRHAYSIHVIDTDRCTWSKDNWLQRKVAPTPIYVS